MRLLALAAALVLRACDALPQWVGMSPVNGSSTAVGLFSINNDGSQGAAVSTVTVQPGEQVQVDAFRCMPYGTFCLFSTNFEDVHGGVSSFLYNVSLNDGSVISKTLLSGVDIHNMHVDHTTGAVYTIALAGGGDSAVASAAPAGGVSNTSATAVLIQVLGGAVTQLVDLSSYLPGNGTAATDAIIPGSTTQCSDSDTVWVGVRSGSAGQPGGAPDTLLTVSYASRSVVATTQLADPLPLSLWANCDTQTVGGAVYTGSAAARRALEAGEGSSSSGSGTSSSTTSGSGSNPSGPASVQYVTLDLSSGASTVVAQAAIGSPPGSPPLVPSGLMSQPPFADYFIALFPEGSTPYDGGADATPGLFAYASFGSPTMTFLQVKGFVTGAAAVSWF